jgi:NAD-dependent SIR2 family protein deacetylase
MTGEVKPVANEKVSKKPDETRILIFIGSSEAVQHYRNQIEDLRKEGMVVLVIVNEEVASPTLITPMWTYVGKAELDRFLGLP